MGRSTTPTFQVQHTTNIGFISAAAWDCKAYGRPTNANAAEYRRKLNESLQPGGVNGPRNPDDVVLHVTEVRVYRQNRGPLTLVASDHAPMFEVV